MSGGSYNYLCNKDARELLDMDEELGWMVDRLATDYPDASEATRAVRERLAQIKTQLLAVEAVAGKLERVWHAVEWCDSCDSSEKDVIEAVARWREKQGIGVSNPVA